MRGSAAFRTSVTPGGALAGAWTRNSLWTAARAVPSLDLRFAENKSLVDATTGQNLVTFNRLSSGTYVDSQGVIKTATTDAPRFDHNPTTGESLGLLVEGQRVNYCLQSEAFGTSPWSASDVTVTANTETSPASTLTADTLAATSGNGTVTQPVTTTAVAMTFSVYLKRKTGTGNIDITANGTTWVTQTINSSTWTRCIVTQTAVAGTSNPGVRIVTSGDEVYAWGGQYELASFPSSYIPTSGSTVTRAADVASISGANFSSWYNASEGTLFAHFDTQTWNSNTEFPKVFTLGDGPNENIWIGSDGITDDVYRYRVRSGGVNYFGPANTSRTKSSHNKAAIALSSNSALSVDGASAITASSVTVPSVTNLTIGADEGSAANLHNGTIRRLTYWKARLPNSTLSTITQ